jgi:hypothetical protein
MSLLRNFVVERANELVLHAYARNSMVILLHRAGAV